MRAIIRNVAKTTTKQKKIVALLRFSVDPDSLRELRSGKKLKNIIMPLERQNRCINLYEVNTQCETQSQYIYTHTAFKLQCIHHMCISRRKLFYGKPAK